MRKASTLLPWLCSFSAWATAPSVEIIPLRSRRAEEVIPILKPLLESDGSISGMKDQLVVKSSPENIAQIRQVLSQIDRKARSLTVSFAQISGQQNRARHTGVSGSAQIGETVEVTVQRDGKAKASSLELRGSRSQVRLEGEEINRGGGVRRITRVQVVDGSSAVTHLDGTAGGGLTLTPKLQGDSAVVDLKQDRGLETSVSAPLGKWVLVGRLLQSSDSKQSSLGTRTTGAAQSAVTLYLRVDESR